MDFFFPGEIRNQIYEHLLVHRGHSIRIYKYWPRPPRNRSLSCSSSWTKTTDPVALEPAILRASKQTHSEARTILYARNHFDFSAEFNRLAPSDYRQITLGSGANGKVIPRGRTLAAFTLAIGPRNRSLVRHISILFPYLPPRLLLQAAPPPSNVPAGSWT
ncbi:hypothetical protein PG993_003588 [Apiospora rasikravindrae]|uniref:Uncharacterized protein n=1 Tax=Apiospora rasikravindrae TaxID=990691 RepID=A0ABR1U2N4_9PEZI